MRKEDYILCSKCPYCVYIFSKPEYHHRWQRAYDKDMKPLEDEHRNELNEKPEHWAAKRFRCNYIASIDSSVKYKYGGILLPNMDRKKCVHAIDHLNQMKEDIQKEIDELLKQKEIIETKIAERS